MSAISPKKSSGPMRAIVIVCPGDSSTYPPQRPASTTNTVSPGRPWAPSALASRPDSGAPGVALVTAHRALGRRGRSEPAGEGVKDVVRQCEEDRYAFE